VPVLVDTSVLFALADADSLAHETVRACVSALSETIVVPVTVLPELDHLLAERLGLRAELAVLRGLIDDPFRIEGLRDPDIERCIELIETYGDSDIGFVDASLVAVAERLDIRRLLTLDRRHFPMIRPRHCPALHLLP
jgi:predicted nucleic acid-binding protein